MTNTPPLNRFLFVLFLLAVLAVGVAALIWPSVRAISYAPVRDALIPDFYLNPAARIPVRLTVAVTPRLEEWAKRAAADFSDGHDLIRLDVRPLRDSDAERQLSSMTGLPDIWIAETEWTRILAGGIPYHVEGENLAQDSLIWVLASARQDFPDGLGWLSIARAAAADAQFRIALPPLGSLEGMAACYSAAAEYHGRTGLTAVDISDPGFSAWMASLRQAAPDLSRNPRDQLASRPPQVDAGLVLRSDLAQIGSTASASQPPRMDAGFRFTLYVRSRWNDIPADEADRRTAAAETFAGYLTGATAQSQLTAYGIAGRGSDAGGGIPVPDEATIRALQFCWR